MPLSKDYHYGYLAVFLLFHLSLLGLFFTGFPLPALVLCFALYLIRMWGITAGYHRYFSHKSFKTNRVFQFILAVIAQSSAQQGVLWWANHHRHHHRFSDTPEDYHSPRQSGFWFSHVGWFFTKKVSNRDYTMIGDFQKYPELVWLDKHRYLPAVLLAVGCYAWMGLAGLVVGFCLSTILLYHATFGINSITHVYGRQRYHTGDDSRNSWIFSFLTLGEGWHNNHHYYAASVKQGFHWWQIDITYYVLKLLSWTGLVWDLHKPSKAVIKQEIPAPKVRLKLNAWLDQAGFKLSTITKKLDSIQIRLKRSEQSFSLNKKFDIEVKRLDNMLRCQIRRVKGLPPRFAKETKKSLKSLRRELKKLHLTTNVTKQSYLDCLAHIQSMLQNLQPTVSLA